ncbi:Tyrosine recombinase XerC [Pandoraea horticolens]|uniref:Tyrosine recombinase XerC n=1 Tax=Pandoraea horticolens TaxID=2508298 RepID=A0A5E4ZC11_9BURK|nr:tyrosine-type recombinase/integrase [Pandoraea horticolens]VVE58556.1 Tyrosine recombinase XerC [Pandoraea horticolens]
MRVSTILWGSFQCKFKNPKRRSHFRVRRQCLQGHWLRHTFGTHALEHGAALEVVQKLMGHASIATTSKYLHPEKRRRAADMDKVFGS